MKECVVQSCQEFEQYLLSNECDHKVIELIRCGRGILIGGAGRSYFEGNPCNDFDIFCTSRDSASEFTELLSGGGGKILIEESDSQQVFNKILFQEKEYDITYKNTLNSFDKLLNYPDFTVCQFLCTNGKIFYHKNMTTDITNKELHYLGSDIAIESRIRMKDFVGPKYGYSITEIEKQLIINECRKQ